ncbi:MAG: dTMP kinase [Candidatus Pacebacteria bacterium]|jgi:dTMP kinase|nr:dTMP kinase [Candidatus Paceibacterota bacterium]
MKRGKGFFIVLDGIDGSGKATQTELLIQRLKKAGYKTGTIDFPQYYDNFFGKLTGEYLTGKLGSVDPKLASILYALDRWESKGEIEKALKEGKVFVCDRYMSANMIHQGGRVPNAKNRKEMMVFLKKMEFEIFGIPKPDIVLYLDVLPEVGRKLVGKKDSRAYTKGKKRDVHESDKQHLTNARNQALRLVKENDDWKKVDCMKSKEILPPEEVSELIWREVEGVLGK